MQTGNGVERGRWQQSSLALKITGIVFWGLVVMGAIFGYFLLQQNEALLLQQLESSADRYAFELEMFLDNTDRLDVDVIEPELNALNLEYGLAAIEVDISGELFTAGSLDGDVHKISRTFRYHNYIDTNLTSEVVLKLFFPPLNPAIKEQGKELIIMLGILFLIFGFILQWILQRVLTLPFLRMVDTAKAISNGNNSVRFDQKRHDEFGYLATFINQSLDNLTQQKEALFHEKERAEITLHSIGDAVITTDAEGHVRYLNPVAEQITGYTQGEVKGLLIDEIFEIVNSVTHKPIINSVRHCLTAGTVVTLDKNCLLRRHDGREVAITESASPIRDRDGRIVGAITVFQDISHTRHLAQKLTYQAMHDALTGLYNRREFENQLQAALDNAREEGQCHVLCYMDLDQFKIVNDTCGHIAGDELLRQLCSLLQREVRGTDILARLGGDELGVLLTYCDIEKARGIADHLHKTVRDFHFVWEEHSFDVRVSIGMVEINAQSRNIMEIMSAADMACYAAKDAGRNRVHLYQPDDSELKQRHGEMQWVSRLNRSLHEDRFELFFQPIVPILDGQGSRRHYEVLLRLHDDEGKLVPPMAFIPAAERYNLMTKIDRWVISKTLKMIQGEHFKSGSNQFAINLSGLTLSSPSILDFVTEQFEQTGVDPANICFEITETAAIANLSRASEFIRTMRRLGCSFALDDFGSGLSSFAYLKNMDVDYLKIDGSFVRDIVENPIHRAMVEAVIKVGHVVGIEIIAEYVEDKVVLEALRGMGVDFVQGHYIARPRPLSEWLPFQADTLTPSHLVIGNR